MPDATVEVNTQRMDGDWARTVILAAYFAVTFQAAWLAGHVCYSLQRNHDAA